MSNRSFTKIKLLHILIIIAIVSLDLISKNLIINNMNVNTKYNITNYMNISYVKNFGIAFGLLSAPTFKYIKYVLSIVSTLVIYLTLYKVFPYDKNKYSKYSRLLITGGSTGNIIDRILHGFVIDFIDFHYKCYHFYTFNLSDLFIIVGLCLLFAKQHQNF